MSFCCEIEDDLTLKIDSSVHVIHVTVSDAAVVIQFFANFLFDVVLLIFSLISIFLTNAN